jgi:hypothetical protein
VFSYATPSAFRSDFSRSQLSLSCDEAQPLHFVGRVSQHVSLLRFCLRALGEVIWSSDDASWGMDPVLSLYPDRMIWEGFSADTACYARLSVDSQIFEVNEPVSYGTTNVNFTSWLWSALGEMRSSRETFLRLSTAGVEVDSGRFGGRFEPQVELPPHWTAAFLEVQQALSRPYTRLLCEPIDLLAPIRFLRHNKAKVSPRGLRYERSGEDWQMVLEPWEKVFPVGGGLAGPVERRIRTWGRQRLRLLEPLLPFADGVEIRLCGRALPHFYWVFLPGMTFLLGLTGWARQSFEHTLLNAGIPQPVDEALLEQRRQLLAEQRSLPVDPLDTELVRRGQAMLDPELHLTRYRPLKGQVWKTPPPDPRVEEAAGLQVEVLECVPVETRKLKKLPGESGQREVVWRDWRVRGSCQGESLELQISEREQIVFGRCGCNFFQTHLLNQGPCAHLLALYEASREQRRDGPTSRQVEGVDGDE